MREYVGRGEGRTKKLEIERERERERERETYSERNEKEGFRCTCFCKSSALLCTRCEIMSVKLHKSKIFLVKENVANIGCFFPVFDTRFEHIEEFFMTFSNGVEVGENSENLIESQNRSGGVHCLTQTSGECRHTPQSTYIFFFSTSSFTILRRVRLFFSRACSEFSNSNARSTHKLSKI
jgi:hypothetical protein